MAQNQSYAVIVKGLANIGKHDVHFFAPQGSEPIGTFHPLACYNGGYAEHETLNIVSLEGLTTNYFVEQA